MLITNFSAGELSKNLFGRTDIPQYYSGASMLENFDVIPTGGLKRRGGTEHVMPLEGNGRIIPFVVNRDLNFLIYLTPENIKVFKLEKEKIPADVSPDVDGLELYKDINVIREIQYAQNFDTMILVHEGYQPIIIKIENDNIAGIENFKIDIKIDLPQEGIDKNNYKEFDKYYEDNKWLSDGDWPKAVTFFGNRLIFACTKNNRQRIFASASGNYFNFSTYKKFVEEKKEYVAIYGKIIGATNEIKMLKSEEFGNFTQRLSKYYLQSPYFSESAMLAGIIGDRLQVVNNIKEFTMSQEEINLFLAWKEEKENDNLENGIIKWSKPYKYYEDRSGRVLYHPAYHLQYSLGKFRTGMSKEGLVGQGIEWYEIIDIPNEKELTKKLVTKRDEFYNYIYHAIDSPTSDFAEKEFYLANFNLFIDDFYNYNYETMIFPVKLQGAELALYGAPWFICQQVMDKIDFKDIEVTTYITLYTKEPIIDRYPTPDCGFTFEIASDTNDAIQWLAVNKGLIVGTETGEWIIPPDVHATNVQAVLNSRYGSDKMQGTAIGDATCFFQTGKKSLVEYYIPQQDNNFRANNMAMLSDDMLRGSPAVDFDYTNSPYTKLIITREDGQAVTLLYERSTGTFAWSRLITNGKIMSVAVIPNSDGYDDIFMIVERSEERTLLWDDPPNTPTVTRKYFLEALRENSDVYLDCYMPVTFRKQVDSDGAEVTNSTPMYMRISLLGYGNESVVYDKVENKIYPVKEITDNSLLFEKEYFIGYKYTSRVVSMPILANNSMKPNNIKNLLIRFLDSFLPKLIAHPNGAKDIIPGKEPFSGVKKTMFPGVWDHDVMFELYHDAPTRCKILAINTEVN